MPYLLPADTLRSPASCLHRDSSESNPGHVRESNCALGTRHRMVWPHFLQFGLFSNTSRKSHCIKSPKALNHWVTERWKEGGGLQLAETLQIRDTLRGPLMARKRENHPSRTSLTSSCIPSPPPKKKPVIQTVLSSLLTSSTLGLPLCILCF